MSKHPSDDDDELMRQLDQTGAMNAERSAAAQARAAQAYARLLHLAETRDSGQIVFRAGFVQAVEKVVAFCGI